MSAAKQLIHSHLFTARSTALRHITTPHTSRPQRALTRLVPRCQASKYCHTIMTWQRPRVSAEQATQLASTVFGITIDFSTCTELVSYDDQNLYMQELKYSNQKYILKVHNTQDSHKGQQLEAQSQAMLHLASRGVVCSTPVPCVSSLPCSQHEQVQPCTTHVALYQPCTSSTTVHPVRLLRWVEGTTLSRMPQAETLLTSWGILMGRVSAALSDFHAPALHHTHDWRLEECAATITRNLPDAQQALDEQQRSMLNRFLQDWAAALPHLHATLPSQICHTDGNDDNVLVDAKTQQGVVGLLDFGDMCYTWRAAECAITMAYAMMLVAAKSTSDGDGVAQQAQTRPLHDHRVFKAGNELLAGFMQEQHLNSDEVAALPLLIRARLALSLVNGCCAVLKDPDNAEYVLQTQVPGWKVMQLLDAAARDAVTWQSLS